MPAGTSHHADLDGPTHYVDFGGPKDAPVLVMVHGLGGSHTNWSVVGPDLAEDHRVYALDLAGHGRTRPDHRRTDVHSNQGLLDRFLHEVAGTPVVLMGNSMGGIVSILQASRHPDAVSELVLLDPAIPGARGVRPDPQALAQFASYAVPGLGAALLARRRKRLTPEQQVHQVLSLCTVDPARVPRDAVEHAVALVAERRHWDGIDQAFLDAARSVMLTLARPGELTEHMSAVRAPVLLLQGENDRLVPVQAAELAARRHPDWTVEIKPDVGHVPMLEAPDWTLERYRAWRADLPERASA